MLLFKGNMSCVERLVESGADVNLSTEGGRTALILAVSKGHT